MRTIALVILLGFLAALLGSPAASCQEKKDLKYVGVKTCGMCHKTGKQGKQLDRWKDTKHAAAYKSLLTDKADQVAKEKGSEKPAAESPECLKCHVTAYGVDAKMVDKSFDSKNGVQCEACHGPGSAYKSMAIMKDKAKAIAAGLKAFKDEKAIEEFCKTCHNEESPTYKEFKFADMWAKIKHPVPKK
jgi:nitrate/TMAO reductase-like tetraheme cytochrome c subunit